MNNKVEIGFGVGLTRDRQPIEPDIVERAMKEIRDAACHDFGGCTVTETEGDWTSTGASTEGVRFSEPGRTVSFYMEATERPLNSPRVRYLIHLIKTLLGQEAVILCITPCTVYTI